MGLSIASGPGWAPRSAAAMRTFVRGDWQLAKSMSYQLGGVTSTFAGRATFDVLRHADRELLTYYEEGSVTMDGVAFTAHKRYLWDCSGEHVSVYFDEATDRSPESIVNGMRFFHEIRLDGDDSQPVRFEHNCEPDFYQGQLQLASPDTFSIAWRITGPRKDGVIDNMYTRIAADQESG